MPPKGCYALPELEKLIPTGWGCNGWLAQVFLSGVLKRMNLTKGCTDKIQFKGVKVLKSKSVKVWYSESVFEIMK